MLALTGGTPTAGAGRMTALSTMIVEMEALVIPSLPDSEIIGQPDDRIFAKAQDDLLRIHFDLTCAEPGEALWVARLLAADGKFAAVVHGESDAWPTGGLWPPTWMSQFSPDDGSCSAALIVDGDRRGTIPSTIPDLEYVSQLRNVGAIFSYEENALLLQPMMSTSVNCRRQQRCCSAVSPADRPLRQPRKPNFGSLRGFLVSSVRRGEATRRGP